MVQLSVNVDGQKDTTKKPVDTAHVPIPEKPGSRVVVRKGRCSKTAVCVSVVTALILVAVAATLLGVFLSRNKTWRDCVFGNDDGDNDNWHEGGGSDGGESDGGESDGGGSHGGGSHGGGSHGGGSHGGGSHGGGSHGGGGHHGGESNGNCTTGGRSEHGGHGGHDGDGGHGGHGGGHGGPGGGHGGHGGEQDDDGRQYPGNEGHHLPDGRP